MKKSKKLYILIGILIGMCVLTFAATHIENKKEDIKESGENALEIPVESVKGISWNIREGNKTFSFHKKENNWIYDEDEAFPVDSKKIEKILKHFEAFAADFVIDDVEDYGQYGLDLPQGTVTLETEDKNYDIQLGAFSKMDSERYVTTGDEKVYLMKEDPMKFLDVSLKNFIKNDEIPDLEDVVEMTFEGENGCHIICEENEGYSYRKDDKYFEHEQDEVIPIDTKSVEEYLSKVEDLDFGKYVTYNATDEELKKYGMDDPALKVTIRYNDLDEEKGEEEKTLVISATSNEEEKEDENTVGYVRINDSKILYEIAGESYKDLIENAGKNLRYKNIIPAELSDVSSIEISMDGQEYVVTAKEKGGDVKFCYEDQELESTDFKDALTRLNAKKFTDEINDNEKELSMLITLDQKNSPQIQIDFYRYDGQYCLATKDDKPFALVNRDSVIDLKEAVNNFVLGSKVE